MSAARSLCVCTAITVVFCAPVAHAQSNRIWAGSATPDNKWTTIGNWNLGVPSSGDTAFFNNAGNANTSISLAGTTQPINTIEFDNGITPSYALGTLGSGDKFVFDVGGSIIETSTVATSQVINADLQLTNSTVSNSGTALTLGGNILAGGTLTVNNQAAAFPTTTTTLGGNITEVVGNPVSLTLSGTTGPGTGNTFIINGTNTYTGPTSITVNTTTTGSIQIGSNSPFGTGQVTLTLLSLAPQFSSIGGDHTIPNAIKLNSGMTYIGTNSLSLSGPLVIFNPAAGGGRTLTNQITAAGKSLTLGATPNSSTVTLGGADGIGKVLVLAPGAGSTTVVNDVIQDPAVGGGAASGSVQFAGSAGITRMNGLSTYTGGTQLNGTSTVQIGADFNAGDLSGPFGVGTITANNSTNNVLQPVGGDRTIANPISMLLGITVGNAVGDNSGLTLSGPITMGAIGRTLTNNMVGGTLTLGAAASPSTWTLPSGNGQTISIIGTGGTVINDVVQNAAGNPSPTTISLAGTGVLTLNALNTYTGDTTITGQAENVRLGSSSNNLPGASFTAGPLGTGTVTLNNTTTAPVLTPVGADRSLSNAITLTSGMTATNLAGTPYSLTLAGPITLGANPRIISNNILSGASLVFGSATAPSTFTLNNSLTIQTQVAGAGSTIINDKLTGNGGLTVQGGAVVQLNNPINDFNGPVSVVNVGSKLLVNGTETVSAGAMSIGASGTLGGNGTIKGAVGNLGTIAPGTGVGTLTTTGDVTMAANSHLAIELGGGTSDKLVVGGTLDLSSSEFLDLTGVGSGSSWVIATYAALDGIFNHVTAGYTVNYGTGTNSQITLMATASGVKGDFNNNGRVDAADYVLWRDRVGSGTALPNDNGLGTPIGQAQYDLWRSNFNKPGSGSGSLESGAVPEPTSVVLFGLALLSMMPVRSRR
ncbi:MAG TPA: hypothetical protein VH107_08905 [Lacipirellulaceae bacterium]|jgi:autotransporter-associated beta strand protein|nr:hypothetical protein [Lacipirellulaceae bacterium]